MSSILSGTLLTLSGSKSETNRVLLLQALYPKLDIVNAAKADDSDVMQRALLQQHGEIDVHHAGTAMRFLTAYFATKPQSHVILTGSARMKERPIGILVTALQQLGASITYLEKEGFPPLLIKGQKIEKNKVSLPANISSQYISALLLVAATLENGLEMTLEGKITSVPYIKMTLALLAEIGVETHFEDTKICIKPLSKIPSKTITIESDWSSASYWFSTVALSAVGTSLRLSSFKEKSLQGDAALITIYEHFGVKTQFDGTCMQLIKVNEKLSDHLFFDLKDCPDIAQTIVVTCIGLGIGCKLIGLHTLKIKETDRLVALQTELSQLGGQVSITEDSLYLQKGAIVRNNIAIATYQDHRMAMAFAPLALKTTISIKEAEVVSKSYPSFWEDCKKIGLKITI